ncbi:MAG: chemotaxis response regulator protein-glutamate methylesterase [Nitrospirota bacterium]|nr:chemotaxis response regulator protein-glutamate methylesterase [Nitrospirota bacterium]
MKRIRVLVVDDSALMRKMIPQILATDPGIEVMGTAMDGMFALKKIAEQRPDVITLDMDMPRMNGMETLKRIVEEYGIPVIVVSSLTLQGAELTFRALEVGAFDFVTKPKDAISLHIKDISDELIGKIRAAVDNPHARLRFKRITPPEAFRQKRRQPFTRTAERVLAIGISTGGPNALSYLLPLLPKEFPAGIVIVQHMPAGFTEMFASRLNSLSAIEVKEAQDGDLVLPGRALIAPGDRHLKVKRLPLGAIAVLSDGPAVSGHRPSADVLFRSVAAEYGASATGLIMTGMGSDGAEGIGEIKAKGGHTIAQDEKSCVVYGMPKSAVEKNHIRQTVPLDELGPALTGLFAQEEVVHGTNSR